MWGVGCEFGLSSTAVSGFGEVEGKDEVKVRMG